MDNASKTWRLSSANQPNTDVVARGHRGAPVAGRRAADAGIVAPAAAPAHAVTVRRQFPSASICRRIAAVALMAPVLTPFRHVAVHIIKAESVREKLPNSMGAVTVSAIPGVLGQVAGTTIRLQADRVAEGEPGCRPGATRVLPFGFGRETERSLAEVIQGSDEGLAVVP